MGVSYDSGNYAAILEKAVETVGYSQLRQEQQEARRQGRLMGIGIATYGEICAFGPSPALPTGGWESATVKIEPSGQVTVMTGVSPPRTGVANHVQPDCSRRVGGGYRRHRRDPRGYVHRAARGWAPSAAATRPSAERPWCWPFGSSRRRSRPMGPCCSSPTTSPTARASAPCNKTGKTVTLGEIAMTSWTGPTYPRQHTARTGGDQLLGAPQLRLPLRGSHRGERGRSGNG